MNNILGQLGGRKFLVAVFGLVAVILAAKWGIDIKPYENTVIGIVGTFLLGQGVADGLSGGATSTAVQASKDVG